MEVNINRHRGAVAHSPLPHHQDMRVRIRRFSSVELMHIRQPWHPERVEVSNRKCVLQFARDLLRVLTSHSDALASSEDAHDADIALS
jgi:hypothetical protein